MRVVFLGNHTVGVRVLETLLEHGTVTGVVAHPQDPEDGVRYESVYDFSQSKGLNTVRMQGKDPELKAFIQSAQPDLLWITDYRYLIPLEIIQTAPLGAVNLHPSLLPKYRGRASINWAILNGEETLGLTAHFVDEGMDSGDIIEQVSYQLTPEQDVGDALETLYPLYQTITQKVIGHFHSGHVPRQVQDHAKATAFPRRKPEDGLIDWQQPAQAVHNLVRAVAHPYPGAFTFFNDHKLMIWKAQAMPEMDQGEPGQIVSVNEDLTFFVQCGRGSLKVLKFHLESENDIKLDLKPGQMLYHAKQHA